MDYVWAILIGIACGIVAGIPTSALIIVALARLGVVQQSPSAYWAVEKSPNQPYLPPEV